MSKPITAIIVGAGHRAMMYASLALTNPEKLQIVGVADPVQAKSIPAKKYWNDWRECLDEKPEADLVMITMPDALHHEPALVALKSGYHIILEKPISPTEAECREVIECALAEKRLVVDRKSVV